MTIGHRRIEAIATGQRGSFSRSQAHASGLSDRQLRRRVQSGVLQQVGPHAFRIWGASRTPLVDLSSLLLDIGEPCAASGPTAAGLARCCRAEALARAIDSAIRDRLTSEEQLHRRIAALRGHGRHGIPALLDVLNGNEVTRGGHSWLEREFLRLVASAGLPRPATQQVLTRAGDRMVRVDCRFPGTNVVVELLGYRFHRTRDQLRRDAERANALMLDGFVPYQFTYDHVVHEPAHVLTTTTRALHAAP